MSPAGPDDRAEGLIEDILQRGDPGMPPEGQASEVLTFLVADIRGYTTFTQQRGDEAAEKLTAKFAMIVRELVAQFGGTVFELRGDEALCVFSSPRQSLRLAVAVQQRFVEETLADANLPMTVGIGIDAGEAVRGSDGYRGGALNLAARLCSQAKAGQVLASPEVAHVARTIDGIRYTTLDRVTLKGLAEPIRPVRVFPDGEDPATQMATLIATATPTTPTPGPRWLPQPLARHPRLSTLAAALVAVLVAGILVITLRDNNNTTTGLTALSENSLGLIDPSNGRLVSQVGLDDGPTAAAAGYGSIWTANTDANTVSRVDQSTHQVNRIPVGTAPSAIVTGLGGVWVANSGSGTVSRIDPTTGATQSIAVGVAPGGLAVSGASVWVTNTAAATVSRIDPAQNKVVETIPVGDSPSGVGTDGHDIWVANSGDSTVSEINGAGRTHAVTQVIHVGGDPKGVAVIDDSVWVTNNLDGTVARIATTGTSVAETVPLGPGAEPAQIAVIDDRVWVAMQGTEAIAEIDPGSAHVVRTIAVGAIPGGVAAAGGRLWVTTTINPTLHRGGVVRILGQDVGSADPTYLSVESTWLLNGSYDGLVGFRHATGADGTVIVPDLATAIPAPIDSGRTYTFQLRTGIRWSTGAPLTVFDVQRGLERAIASGISPLQQMIVGASGCEPSRCDISGIAVAPAASTVTITLAKPNANLLDDLTGAPAVPAATPLAEQKSRPIAATGPYQVSSYVPGKLAVLTRNRYFREWSAAAQPAGFPDEIRWQIDPSPVPKVANAHAADAVAAGQTDWGDVRGSAPVGALDARFGGRVHVTPTETLHGLSLNTRIPPFNDVRVRRALGFALDRAAIAADWFTPASITCQILPPNVPGYRPYCPYTLRPDATGTWQAPDFPAAVALVKASHTSGMTVNVVSSLVMALPLRHVVSALIDLGYHARLIIKADPANFSYVADSRNKAQAGFFGWVPSDVSASGFLGAYRCDAFTPASPDNVNTAEFCDPSIDNLMSQAERAQLSSPAAGNDLWAQVDRRVVDAAPWIPLVTPSWVDVVSPRVHNYQRSPVLGVLFDQMWLT